MAKIKINCPICTRSLQCEERYRGRRIKCPHCKHLFRVPVISFRAPKIPATSTTPTVSPRRRTPKKKLWLAAGIIVLTALLFTAAMLFVWPTRVHWPDRRPIGALFLASDFHASATNPRGWFNDPSLDVTGPGGQERFRQALMAYADRSIAILKRANAQGAIVWDLEGEQFPHKTTYIGDPRLLKRLAPEMAAVADEFFVRLRNAGLRVGMTIRPQQLIFDNYGVPRQTQVFDTKKVLLDKIDYARKRWGATLFYLDSNGGIRRPDEVWQLRQLAGQRPDILLIPEHSYLPYAAFTAPYAALRRGDPAKSSSLTRRLFPGTFRVLDIGGGDEPDKIVIAQSEGDILLFPAWWSNPASELMEHLAEEKP
jgi:hypothetical protein